MNLNERQQQTIDLISREREVRINDLKERFAVTEMTIRRDLEKLEQLGLIRRTFGGAILESRDIALLERTMVLIDEKKRIGKAAAALVQPDESIFIDGGSTTLQVARYLPTDANITVVTNALNIVQELHEHKIQTIVIGGTYLEATSSLVGPIAAEALSRMAFQRIFLGATGISPEHGFSNSNVYEAEIKKLAMKQSGETNIVLDHTKFGIKMLTSFAELKQVGRVIADRMPDKPLLTACREAGVEVVAAE